MRGEAAFFINKRSVLQMGDYTLRNPPHFMSFRTPLRRDAMYETEALLHHLMHHRNTPPFVAYRLIQRLVTSNPSPRYTKVVADAFRTSTYDGERYPGGYGSLAAAVHAILLDREARSPTLDLDPSHGQLREPLLIGREEDGQRQLTAIAREAARHGRVPRLTVTTQAED